MRETKIGVATAGAICAAAACLLIVAAWSGSGDKAPRLPERPASTPASPAAAIAAHTQPSQPATQAAIQAIKERYADVGNRLQTFRHVERELSGFSTDGGTLDAFFDRDALRLVKATFYGETGRSDRAFYYDDSDRPFFVFERESRYKEPLSGVAITREYRAYFHEGRLIRLLDGDRQISAGDAAYASRETELLELSGRLADAARRP